MPVVQSKSIKRRKRGHTTDSADHGRSKSSKRKQRPYFVSIQSKQVANNAVTPIDTKSTKHVSFS